MFGHEWNMIMKDRRTKLIFLFMIGLVVFDLYRQYDSWFFEMGYLGKWEYASVEDILHPAEAAFLSATTIGHIAQMLYLWFLPVYLLLMYCDKAIAETKSGYFNVLILKVGKKKVLRTKYKFAFLLGFLTTFSSLMINYIATIILFGGGKEQGLEVSSYPDHIIFTLSMQHPYTSYFIYILVVAVLAGGCAMICMGLSFMIYQYRYLYLASFLIWYLQIIAPCSLDYVMQPFIEYDIEYMIPAILVFMMIWCSVVLIGYVYRMKKDEL